MTLPPRFRHLAHLNVARMRAALDAPIMAEFVAQLAAVNQVADESSGFIWRMVDDDPNDPATLSLGECMLVNLSVWTGPQALADFVYRSAHGPVMRRRREWFLPHAEPHLVLWWVAAGALPTTAEAVERLRHLREHGPSPWAFTFSSVFPA